MDIRVSGFPSVTWHINIGNNKTRSRKEEEMNSLLFFIVVAVDHQQQQQLSKLNFPKPALWNLIWERSLTFLPS
jgi:hypothetical protein